MIAGSRDVHLRALRAAIRKVDVERAQRWVQSAREVSNFARDRQQPARATGYAKLSETIEAMIAVVVAAQQLLEAEEAKPENVR